MRRPRQLHQPAHMLYYVLNNGLELWSPREGIAPAAVELMRPLVEAGGRLPRPYEEYEVEIAHKSGGALYSLWYSDVPLATTGTAWLPATAPRIWSLLEHIYLDVSDRLADQMGAIGQAICPETVPWVCSVLFPGYPKNGDDRLGWCGDFIRSFAWVVRTERS